MIRSVALLPRLVLVLVLVLGADAPARAQDKPASDPNATVRKIGRDRYDSGSYGDAAEAARAALESGMDADALALLAISLEAIGEEAEAEKELRAALASTPTSSAAVKDLPLLLGEHLVRRGRHADALPFLKERLDPFAREVRRAVAASSALLALGRRDEAAAELGALFEAWSRSGDDTAPEALRGMGRAALIAEKIPALARVHVRPFAKDARDFYQQAWKAGLQTADLLAEWGRIYAEKWDLVEARRLAREAVKKNARHARAHALLAEVDLQDPLGGTDKYDSARRAIDTALGVNPSLAEAHVLQAELLLTDALYPEALAALEKALAARPDDLRALATRAGVLKLTERGAEAAAIEKDVAGRGNLANAEFSWRLAALLDSKFHYQDAYAYGKRAIELDPDCWPAYGQLGLGAMRVGDEETARKYLEKAHEADPFDLFTFNQCQLLEKLARDFVTIKTEHFVLRLHKEERTAMEPYIVPLLERCWAELATRYGVKLDSPILFEVFPNLQDFSVRAVAHRFIPASGVTFARVVALASPAAFPSGTHGWGRVLWHELAHVATLERSAYRVPRWLTEGLAVFEESKGHKAWVREWDVDLVDAIDRGRLLPILELNLGFSKPKFPNQVMLSYYQGGLICQFIEQTVGFEALLKLLDGYRAGLPVPENLSRALGMTPKEFDERFLAYAKKSLGEVRYRAACDDGATLSLLRKASKAKPKDKDALGQYALAAADLDRWADAETAAAQLRKLDPSSGDAMLVQALVHRHRKEWPEMVKAALDASVLGTRDPILAEMLQAEYYMVRDEVGKPRDLRKAIAAVENANALFPRHPGYVNQLVGLYREAKDEKKLRTMLARFAELQPNAVEQRVELAEGARQAGDTAAQLRWSEELIWLNPLAGVVHLQYGHALKGTGKLEPAREEAKLAVTLAAEGLAEIKKTPGNSPQKAARLKAFEALHQNSKELLEAVEAALKAPAPGAPGAPVAPQVPSPTAVPETPPAKGEAF